MLVPSLLNARVSLNVITSQRKKDLGIIDNATDSSLEEERNAFVNIETCRKTWFYNYLEVANKENSKKLYLNPKNMTQPQKQQHVWTPITWSVYLFTSQFFSFPLHKFQIALKKTERGV